MGLPLVASDFTFQYTLGQRPALSEFSLVLREGECCAVVGPSGAGKSTLLYAFAGVLGHHFRSGKATGRLQVGHSTYEPCPGRILFPEVGMTLENPALQISGMRETVRDELLFTLENIRFEERQRDSQVEETLRTLDIAHLATRHPAELSGGELQRAALGSILVADPSVLLLDEPSTALDTRSRQRLVRILRAMRQRTTILLTSSDVEIPLQIAQQFIVLDGGRVVFSGTREDFINRMEDFGALIPVNRWTGLRDQLRASTEHRSRLGRLLTEMIGRR